MRSPVPCFDAAPAELEPEGGLMVWLLFDLNCIRQRVAGL
jgi:hypothetical protein